MLLVLQFRADAGTVPLSPRSQCFADPHTLKGPNGRQNDLLDDPGSGADAACHRLRCADAHPQPFMFGLARGRNNFRLWDLAGLCVTCANKINRGLCLDDDELRRQAMQLASTWRHCQAVLGIF
jgi:hypothetical protein